MTCDHYRRSDEEGPLRKFARSIVDGRVGFICAVFYKADYSYHADAPVLDFAANRLQTLQHVPGQFRCRQHLLYLRLAQAVCQR